MEGGAWVMPDGQVQLRPKGQPFSNPQTTTTTTTTNNELSATGAMNSNDDDQHTASQVSNISI